MTRCSRIRSCWRTRSTSPGEQSGWQAECKWDGIRAQVLHLSGAIAIWSRGEENVTVQFPEVATAAAALPAGTVLDWEILGWRDDRPLPFAALQRRLGRKRLEETVLRDVSVSLLAYDLLEANGEDIRAEPLQARRARLEALLAALGPSSPRADRAVRDLGSALGRAGASPGARCRRAHAEAARVFVRRRTAARRLVEVEGGTVHD